MKRDVAALVGGLICWVLSFVAIPLAVAHPRNYNLPATSRDAVFHWTGIFGLLLLLVGSLAVSGAAVSFAGRFDARRSAIAGLLFAAPAVLYSWLSRYHHAQTLGWVFLLVPWFVLLLSGALLVVVGTFRALANPPRS
jgi:hypothetical protein